MIIACSLQGMLQHLSPQFNLAAHMKTSPGLLSAQNLLNLRPRVASGLSGLQGSGTTHPMTTSSTTTSSGGGSLMSGVGAVMGGGNISDVSRDSMSATPSPVPLVTAASLNLTGSDFKGTTPQPALPPASISSPANTSTTTLKVPLAAVPQQVTTPTHFESPVASANIPHQLQPPSSSASSSNEGTSIRASLVGNLPLFPIEGSVSSSFTTTTTTATPSVEDGPKN
jgi:hypothetical protein